MPKNNSIKYSNSKISATHVEIESSQKEMLKRLNLRTGQVKVGGDILWVDMTRYPELPLRSKSAMYADYADWLVLNNDGEWTSAFKWWLSRPDRMKYEEVRFDPAAFFNNRTGPRILYNPEVETRAALNMFTGWDIKPNSKGDCGLFYEHLNENFCAGDAATEKVVLDWMAHVFQYPGKPIGWALAVVGDFGCGKSIVSDTLATIIGKRYSPVFTTPESLLGKFNAPMAKCILGRVEEAINPRDPRHIATMRSLLSGGDVLLELKGVDPILIPSRANFCFTSNSEHFLSAGTQGERRYFAFRCSNGRQQDGAYFAALRRQLEDAGGYGRLLHDLQTRDISAVDFCSPPRTAVLSTQIRAGLSGLDRWWADCLQAGELIFPRTPDGIEPTGWEDWAEDCDRPFSPLKSSILESASAYARDYQGRPPSPPQLGKFLLDVAGAASCRPRVSTGLREHRYRFPSLGECRALFLKNRPGLRLEDISTEADSVIEDTTAIVVNLATARRPVMRSATAR